MKRIQQFCNAVLSRAASSSRRLVPACVVIQRWLKPFLFCAGSIGLRQGADRQCGLAWFGLCLSRVSSRFTVNVLEIALGASGAVHAARAEFYARGLTAVVLLALSSVEYRGSVPGLVAASSARFCPMPESHDSEDGIAPVARVFWPNLGKKRDVIAKVPRAVVELPTVHTNEAEVSPGKVGTVGRGGVAFGVQQWRPILPKYDSALARAWRCRCSASAPNYPTLLGLGIRRNIARHSKS